MVSGQDGCARGLAAVAVEVRLDDLDVAGSVRDHVVSAWFYDVRRRYALGGEAALTSVSRGPHHVANRTVTAIEEEKLALRKSSESGMGQRRRERLGYLSERCVDPVPTDQRSGGSCTATGSDHTMPTRGTENGGRSSPLIGK